MPANNGALMTSTLIMTRPLAQSERFAAEVAAMWDGPLRVIISPLIEIVRVPAEQPDVNTLIFTSANGVDAAQAMDFPKGMTAWCVGAKTAQIAKAAGFETITGPGDADGLVASLISAAPIGSFAHIRGKHARGDIAAHLIMAGIDCVDVVAYDQMSRKLSAQAHAALCATDPVTFPLFSPRTCTILGEQGPFTAPVHAVALSHAVKGALDPRLGWDAVVADAPSGPAMRDAVIAALMLQKRDQSIA